MARGSKQASTAGTSAQNLSNNLEGNANALYGQLAPELEAESVAPQGLAPADLAAENTAAQQSAGGSQAAAMGAGALHAARTRNAGGSDAAIQASTRAAGEDLSKRALGIQQQNTELKQQQHHEGLTGLESLLGEQTGAGIGALGIVPQAVNANTQAQNASWDWAKDLFDPILQAGSKAYAG